MEEQKNSKSQDEEKTIRDDTAGSKMQSDEHRGKSGSSDDMRKQQDSKTPEEIKHV